MEMPIAPQQCNVYDTTSSFLKSSIIFAQYAYIFRYWEIIIILIMMQPAVRRSFDCFISEKAALKCFFICIPQLLFSLFFYSITYFNTYFITCSITCFTIISWHILLHPVLFQVHIQFCNAFTCTVFIGCGNMNRILSIIKQHNPFILASVPIFGHPAA